MRKSSVAPTGADLPRDRLDRVLAAALRPPGLPAGFGAALRQRIDREAAQDLLARRAALDAERARELSRMRAGYVALRTDTLLTLIAAAFTVGAAASVILPRLAAWSGMSVGMLASLLLGTLSLAASGWLLAARFGVLRTN